MLEMNDRKDVADVLEENGVVLQSIEAVIWRLVFIEAI